MTPRKLPLDEKTSVAIYSTVDPLDSRTIEHVTNRAVDAALDAHEHFMDQVKNF
jgi:hypothetical protein